MSLPILLLTGMTPNARVYDRLRLLLPHATVASWIEPQPHEPLDRYCERFAETLEPFRNGVVVGVSFGGIVARQLAPLISARGCCVISSVVAPSELPPWFRIFRRIPTRSLDSLLTAVGTFASLWPRIVRTPSTARLTRLRGSSGRWHRWAATAVLGWRPRAERNAVPTRRIHGSGDTTFPIRYTHRDVVIPYGGHVLPLTHPKEIAAVISELATKMP